MRPIIKEELLQSIANKTILTAIFQFFKICHLIMMLGIRFFNLAPIRNICI